VSKKPEFEVVELPSGFKYLWPIIPIEEAETETELVPYANTKDFYELPGQHALIIGAQFGTGKTTLLYWIMGYHYFENREICIYRMKLSTYEFLSILEQAPIRLFVPSDCDFRYHGPNANHLEIMHFDLWNYEQLFNMLTRDKINVIAVGEYITNIDVLPQKYRWWGEFFSQLLYWKGSRMRLRMGIYLDELADIIPNIKGTHVKGHEKLANWIMEAIDAYRRSSIRIVAVTHTLTDIPKSFRHQIPFWFIKRTHAEVLPWRYVVRYNLARKIEQLENWKVLVQDKMGMFNIKPSPIWVLPKRFSVTARVGESFNEQLVKSEKEALYADRLRLVDEYLKLLGLTVRERQHLMGYNTPSSVVMFEQRHPREQLKLPIDTNSKVWKGICRKFGIESS